MITSTSNPRVKWVRRLQTQRRAREQEGLFVIEGARWAHEAVAAEAPARLVLHTDHLDERARGLVNNLARLGAEVQSVSDPVMAACSETETPPGLLVVLPMLQLESPQPFDLALVVDRLRDPGNLGTLLRTALAAGVQAVFLTPGTVDAYNPKVVRAAMGAHLRLPLRTVEIEALGAALDGLDLWLAESGAGQRYDEVDWHRPVALVIGGEAEGVRTDLRRDAAGSVHIPLAKAAESLNAAVAAAVLLFEIARQRGFGS